MKISRLCAAALVAIAVSTQLAGCVVAADPPPRVAVAAYTPLYYNGYAVYYDAWGVPFYYLGGVPYYVPRTYVRYDALVAHYHTHPGLYRREVLRGGTPYRHYARR
jgi:hypothetical protein